MAPIALETSECSGQITPHHITQALALTTTLTIQQLSYDLLLV